jgi:hypothetical protein
MKTGATRPEQPRKGCVGTFVEEREKEIIHGGARLEQGEIKNGGARVLERPPRNAWVAALVRRDEMKGDRQSSMILLQFARIVASAPRDWYLALNLLRYRHPPSSKMRQRLIYVMRNHPHTPVRKRSVVPSDSTVS